MIETKRGDIELLPQQVDLIRKINISKKNVCVLASSGCSKTSSLIFALTDKTSQHKDGLFLAFNKKIAEELKRELPSHIRASTFHSLAYRHTVIRYGLKVKTKESFDDFKELKFRDRSKAISIFKDYMKSDVIRISDFCNEEHIAIAIKNVFTKMIEGEIPITFNAYLKYFQILLHAGSLDIPETDIILVDEGQDMNACMGSIFLNYPAKQRVAVGDLSQQINQWNGAGSFLYDFSKRDDIVIAELTNTMRCSPEIAKAAEVFCQNNLSRDFKYLGLNRNKPEYKTFLYLTRTNAELVKALAGVSKSGIKSFGLTRKPEDIFKLFLMIRFNAKNEYFYRLDNNDQPSENWKKEDEQYYKVYKNYMIEKALMWKYVKQEIDLKTIIESLETLGSSTMYEFGDKKNEQIIKTINSFVSWLLHQDELTFEHEDMVRAAAVELSLGADNIDSYNVYLFVKKNETKDNPTLILSTANSAKGLTADCTYMSSGLSTALEAEWEENREMVEKNIASITDDPDDDDNKLKNEMANLYYVAFTRSRYCTIGAKLIDHRWNSPLKAKNVQYEGKEKNELDFIAMVKESEKENDIL
jgi:hypothetical protein